MTSESSKVFSVRTGDASLRKSILVTIATFCVIFVPTLFGFGGLFTRSALGIIVFAALSYLSISTHFRIQYPTAGSLAQTIRFPTKTVGYLSTIAIVGWIGLNILYLNQTSSRIVVVIGTSLIEVVSIWNALLDMGALVSYLMGRESNALT